MYNNKMSKWIGTIILSALVAISYNTIADLIADKFVDDTESISTIEEFKIINDKLDRIESLLHR